MPLPKINSRVNFVYMDELSLESGSGMAACFKHDIKVFCHVTMSIL